MKGATSRPAVVSQIRSWGVTGRQAQQTDGEDLALPMMADVKGRAVSLVDSSLLILGPQVRRIPYPTKVELLPGGVIP